MRLRYRLALAVTGFATLVASSVHIVLSDRFVERRLQDVLARRLRAPVTFESVTFSFLDGLEVRGLVVLDPEDPLGPEVLRVGRAAMDYTIDLFGDGPRIISVLLEEPVLRVTRRGDGTLSLSALVAATDDETAPPQQLPAVILHRGRLFFTDPTVFATPDPVEIEIDGAWATPPGHGTLASVLVKGRSKILGEVTLQAHLDPDRDLAWTDMSVDLASVDLGDQLARRIGGEIGEMLRDLAPTGTVKLSLTATPGPAGDPQFDGRLTLQDVGFQVQFPEDVTGQPAPEPVEISGLSGVVELGPDRLTTRDLSFRALEGTVSVDADVTAVHESPGDRSLEATVRVKGLQVTPATQRKVPFSVREILYAYTMDVLVDLEAEVTGPLHDPDVRVTADVRGGSMNYVGYVWPDGERYGFPYPVDNVQGRVVVDGPLIRIDGSARRGDALILVKGTTESIREGVAVNDIHITATDVTLDETVRAGFGDAADRKFDRWGPSGVAARVEVHVESDLAVNDGASETHVIVEFDGRAVFRPEELPTPLRVTSGKVEILRPVVDGARIDVVNIRDVRAVSTNETLSLHVDGTVRGEGANAFEKIDVFGTTTDLGGALRQALLDSNRVPDEVKDTVTEREPTGPATFRVELRGEGDVRDDRVRLEFLGASVSSFATTQMPVSELHGDLLVAGTRLTLRKIRGRALGSQIRVDGWIETTRDGPLHLDVEADDLPLGDRLRTALGGLAEPAAAFFEQLGPQDDARGDVRLWLRPPNSQEPEIRAVVSGLVGGIRPLGLAITAQTGRIEFDGRQAKARLSGRLGEGAITIEDCVVDTETGAVSLLAAARGLAFPEDLRGLFTDETVRSVSEFVPGRVLHLPGLAVEYDPSQNHLTLLGPFTFRPRSRGDETDQGLAPDGEFGFSDFHLFFGDDATSFHGELTATDVSLTTGIRLDGLCGVLDIREGRFSDAGVQLAGAVRDGAFRTLERQFTDARLNLALHEAGNTEITGFEADFYGGKIRGDVSAGRRKLAYRGEFTIKDADAGQVLGANPDDHVGGRLDATIAFRNRTGLSDALTGKGKVSVTGAHLMAFPVVDQIASQISTDSSRQNGRADFHLHETRLHLRNLELEFLGPAGSLGGVPDGDVWLGFDGRIEGFAEIQLLSVLGNTPVIGELWRFQKFFLGARLGGTVRNPDVSMEFFPLGALFGVGDRTADPEPQPHGDLIPTGPFPW